MNAHDSTPMGKPGPVYKAYGKHVSIAPRMSRLLRKVYEQSD